MLNTTDVICFVLEPFCNRWDLNGILEWNEKNISSYRAPISVKWKSCLIDDTYTEQIVNRFPVRFSRRHVGKWKSALSIKYPDSTYWALTTLHYFLKLTKSYIVALPAHKTGIRNWRCLMSWELCNQSPLVAKTRNNWFGSEQLFCLRCFYPK